MADQSPDQQQQQQEFQQMLEFGKVPFYLEYASEYHSRIVEQFNYLNKNCFLISEHLRNLLSSDQYQVDGSKETITFATMQNAVISVSLEKVELNDQDKEQNLLAAIVSDLSRRFSGRPALPYNIERFQEFSSASNTINVELTNLGYTGLDTFAYILILERLFQLRPAYADEYQNYFKIQKSDSILYKYICEEDVWYSYATLNNEQTITLSFIVLTFEVRDQLKPYLEFQEDNPLNDNHQNQSQEEQMPWYGTRRYDIVDHVLSQQAERDRLAQRSAVQEAALKAQQPFLGTSMKDLGQTYSGPPKYLNQRDAPLEIPIEVVKTFFMAVDQDMDERVSIEELQNYAKKRYLPFEDNTIVEMFREASQGRGIIHEHQRYAPLTLDEIAAAVRGRHRWNPREKVWEVNYRPCRDYWIILLQTVNERLFAIPMPKVVPTKILAQFEEEDLKKTMTMTRKEGVDKKYLSIKEQKQPIFQKDSQKTEAGITPELLNGTIKFNDKKQKKKDQNPYEQQINARLQKQDSAPNNYPKISFESKEFFNQAKLLSSVIPHWNNDKENPIYQYVPTTERPFTNDSDTLFNTQLQQKLMYQSMREQKLHELQTKERTLQLAGTMALNTRKTSPWKVMKERQGFVTKFKVPTILDQKTDAAFVGKNTFDERGKLVGPTQDPYNPPSDHKFRDLEINRGQKDFTLRYKCPDAYNKYGMSEHDTRPKEVIERQRRAEETEKHRRKLEYESILKGKPLEKKKPWLLYHKLPDKLTPVSHQFKDPHSDFDKEKNPFLDKEEFTPAYLQLARQMKDDVVFGKPNFNLYFKAMHPSDLNEEFGGTKTKPFKCIY